MCLCLEIGCLKKSLSIRSVGWTLIQHDPCPLRSWHTGTHRRRRVRMPPTSQGERSQKKHLVSAFHLRNWEKGTLCWLSHQVTGCELPPGGCVTSGKAVFLVEGRGSRLWAVSRQCFWQVLQAEGEWRRPATVSARMELVRVLRDSVHVTVSWDRVFFFFFKHIYLSALCLGWDVRDLCCMMQGSGFLAVARRLGYPEACGTFNLSRLHCKPDS